MNKRLTVRYSGNVHGVGFRFTAQAIARQFSVVGYVMNVPDGRVELVVEGEEEEAKAFAAAVGREMSFNINKSDQVWSDASGEFGQFGIRFAGRS